MASNAPSKDLGSEDKKAGDDKKTGNKKDSAEGSSQEGLDYWEGCLETRAERKKENFRHEAKAGTGTGANKKK
ncbi:predicted protein [Arabidopsis lyrata subsp. lyrata]|uniref:Predicted protein n=1 Tax=Arabidopsis lyrata subsp. lyrata TaxID=81972 RepID=D7L6V9_ARALL|nr:predicted protein [Arabidopsis lyrata subsp. lyrata]